MKANPPKGAKGKPQAKTAATKAKAKAAVGARSKGKRPGKAKAPGAKRPEGRPTKYDAAIHPQLAEAWATAGRTDKQIAEKLGIAERTIANWKNEHPEFMQALKNGKAEPDDRVEACLFARATGYNHPAVKIFMPANARKPVYAPFVEHCPPDVTAQIFWLKNRRSDRWRDKQEVDTNVHTDEPLTLVLNGVKPEAMKP
jgi:hypothetical protein